MISKKNSALIFYPKFTFPFKKHEMFGGVVHVSHMARKLFGLAAYDLTCSPLSKRLEQANNLKAKTWGQKEVDKNQMF